MFIATQYWRGNLKRETLRTFDTEDQCWDYLEGLFQKEYDDHVKNFPHDRYHPQWIPSFQRVYEVFSDKEPRLCKYTRNTFDNI